MSALGARIAELNTAIACGAAGRRVGESVADARSERNACEQELTELEDLYGPRLPLTEPVQTPSPAAKPGDQEGNQIQCPES